MMRRCVIAVALLGLAGCLGNIPGADESGAPGSTDNHVEVDAGWRLEVTPPNVSGSPGEVVSVRATVRHDAPAAGMSLRVHSPWIVDGRGSAAPLSNETVLRFSVLLHEGLALPISIRDAEGAAVARFEGPPVHVDATRIIARSAATGTGFAERAAPNVSVQPVDGALNITFAPPVPTTTMRNQTHAMFSQLISNGPFLLIVDAGEQSIVAFAVQQIDDGQLAGATVERPAIWAHLPVRAEGDLEVTVHLTVLCECNGPIVTTYRTTHPFPG